MGKVLSAQRIEFMARQEFCSWRTSVVNVLAWIQRILTGVVGSCNAPETTFGG